MRQRALLIPHDQVLTFLGDVRAWLKESGFDGMVTLANQPYKTTNDFSPMRYLVDLDESFFDPFPHWRLRIEQ